MWLILIASLTYGIATMIYHGINYWNRVQQQNTNDEQFVKITMLSIIIQPQEIFNFEIKNI